MVRLLLNEVLTLFDARVVFQSHNGAIAAVKTFGRSVGEFRFNPTMVRLLRLCMGVMVVFLSRFNPTMVRLLHEIDADTLERAKSFNPTMVRLLLVPSVKPFIQSAFQSHNGAIAASKFCCHSWSVFSFQSHNGAIAAHSTIVRYFSVPSFQSHNGAIAASRTSMTRKRLSNVSIPQWCDCCMIMMAMIAMMV